MNRESLPILSPVTLGRYALAMTLVAVAWLALWHFSPVAYGDLPAWLRFLVVLPLIVAAQAAMRWAQRPRRREADRG